MPYIRTGRVGKVSTRESPVKKPFHIPYFAHQWLDHEKYADIGTPRPALPGRSDDGNEHQVENDAEAEDWDDDEETTTTIQAKKRRRSSLTIPASDTAKRLKITGGRPAMAKKVTADLDSDDELIFSMKNAKYLEKDIAKRLADEGRTLYNPKTIGTRWARLKKVKQTKQDEMLDADLTDWHEGDDDVLYQGHDKAEIYIQKQIKIIEERRWRIVADFVKGVKPVTNFSQNACRKRYEALQAGTAKPCPEADPNPSPALLARIEARRERQERIDRDVAATKNDDKSELLAANIEGNGWTSRRKDKFS